MFEHVKLFEMYVKVWIKMAKLITKYNLTKMWDSNGNHNTYCMLQQKSIKKKKKGFGGPESSYKIAASHRIIQ